MFNGTKALIGKATRTITNAGAIANEILSDGRLLEAINDYRVKEERRLLRYFSKLQHKKKFLQRNAWQRSIRNHKLRSRCRHARKLKAAGVRYKGGK